MYRKFVIFERGFYPRSIGARKRFCRSPRAACHTRGSEQRPEWDAKHRTDAVAEARGHGVLPKGIFKISEKSMKILGQSPNKNQKLYRYIFMWFHIIFFLSQEETYFIKKNVSLFIFFSKSISTFYSWEETGGEQSCKSESFYIKRKYFDKHIPVEVCELKSLRFWILKIPLRVF